VPLCSEAEETRWRSLDLDAWHSAKNNLYIRRHALNGGPFYASALTFTEQHEETLKLVQDNSIFRSTQLILLKRKMQFTTTTPCSPHHTYVNSKRKYISVHKQKTKTQEKPPWPDLDLV
jgi:hypothetical protein